MGVRLVQNFLQPLCGVSVQWFTIHPTPTASRSFLTPPLSPCLSSLSLSPSIPSRTVGAAEYEWFKHTKEPDCSWVWIHQSNYIHIFYNFLLFLHSFSFVVFCLIFFNIFAKFCQRWEHQIGCPENFVKMFEKLLWFCAAVKKNYHYCYRFVNWR